MITILKRLGLACWHCGAVGVPLKRIAKSLVRHSPKMCYRCYMTIYR